MSDRLNLGSCCGCGETKGVETLVMLPWKGSMPGKGWGCFQCGLAMDGAYVVLCRKCEKKYYKNRKVEEVATQQCKGHPATDGREPLNPLAPAHRHNMEKHPEAMPGDAG